MANNSAKNANFSKGEYRAFPTQDEKRTVLGRERRTAERTHNDHVIASYTIVNATGVRASSTLSGSPVRLIVSILSYPVAHTFLYGNAFTEDDLDLSWELSSNRYLGNLSRRKGG